MLNFEGGVVMLKDYEKEQFISYTIIKQSVINDKLSHAYLINANNYEKAFDFALSIAKYIFAIIIMNVLWIKIALVAIFVLELIILIILN